MNSLLKNSGESIKCHAELVSASKRSTRYETLNQVQGDKKGVFQQTMKTVYGQKGFTLVELMIAITITVLALAAVYTSFIVQQRSFVVQDQLSETQISSKIAFDILINRIRSAGFGYPTTETPAINGISGIIATGDGGDGNSPDSITVVGGFRTPGIIGLPTGQGYVEIEQKDATGYYLDICYTTDIRFNAVDMKYLSVDGVSYAEINGIDDNTATADCGILPRSRLYLDRPISIEFPVRRPIYLIENVIFRLGDTDNDGAIDDLEIVTPSETETLASNIEDIQFAYAIEDPDNEGEIDDWNVNGVFDPGDYYFTPNNLDPLPLGAKVLAVRVSLLARTATPDKTLDPLTKPYADGITLENGSTIGAGDTIRRRVWTTEILLRNPR
jgi:prepilin-type N-terminal cleavage/methylation domain-containing protein